MASVIEQHGNIEIVKHSDCNHENINYGFFTSKGGKSEGAFACKADGKGGLNVGRVTGDEAETIEENIELALQSIGSAAEDLVLLRSNYNNKVHTITDRSQLTGEPLDGDGLVSDVPGLVLATVSADAHAIVFVDEKAGIAGIAVGSWKGVAKGVIENTIASMIELGSDPKDITTIVGPGLGKGNYEMGKNVRDFFIEGGVDEKDGEQYVNSEDYAQYFADKGEEKCDLDFCGLIAQKAKNLGLGQALNVEKDTMIDLDFYGARRDTGPSSEHKKTGRNLNYVKLVQGQRENSGEKEIS